MLVLLTQNTDSEVSNSNILESILYNGPTLSKALQFLECVRKTHCSPENEVGQRGRWRKEWGRQRWK